MKLFEGRSAKERKSAIANVIAVMRADGTDVKELEFLGAVCHRVGIPESELKEVLKDPEKVKFVVPESPRERILQFIDCVLMMLMDNKITVAERDVCTRVAIKLGFNVSDIESILSAITAKAKRGDDRTKIAVEVGDFFEN
jgi:2-hydroxychromene-2-carboxylate isomerase